MIFFDFYVRSFSIPKPLAPLADYIKSLQQVIVADQKTFEKVIEEMKEKLSAIPKADEWFLLEVNDGVIGVYKKNMMKNFLVKIYYTPVVGMCGFDSDDVDIHILPVPDDGEGYYTLPFQIRKTIKEGGVK